MAPRILRAYAGRGRTPRGVAHPTILSPVREPSRTSEPSWLQGLAVALCVAVVAGPFLFGRGVDVPDDALYSTVPGWEWLRYAVRTGTNPFWVPGRLGGVSLFTEANAMGPFYPGMWLAWLFPVHLALPLSMTLHLLGSVVTVRWLARTFGASPLAATAAGIGAMAGPVGLAAFIECQADVMALFLWFPAVLACHRRLEQSDGMERVRWVALGGGALALMLTGSHIRHAAGACGALGLWFLLRPKTLLWSAGLTVLGVGGGATGILPALLEWKASQGATDQVAALAVPPLQTLEWSFLASWLAPKPFVTAREFGAGAVIAGACLFGLRGSRGDTGPRSLVLYLTLLLLSAAALPGVRWLLAPLTLLAHPTLILYYALAMIPAAVLGARGLDRLSEGGASVWRGDRLAHALLVALGAGCLARLTPLGNATFGSDGERAAWMVGLGVAVATLVLAWVVLVRVREPGRRLALLMILGALEVAFLGMRVHRAVPSMPLPLMDRAGAGELDLLADGYAHVGELAVLLDDGLELAPSLQSELGEEFDFDTLAMGGEVEDVLAEAPGLQGRLIERRWPIHAGADRGLRSLSGRAKLAPPRQAAMLLPLLRVLNGAPSPWLDELEDWEPGDPWNHAAVSRRAARVFTPEGIGAKTLAHAGIPLAVDESGMRWSVETGLRCFSPRRVLREDGEVARVRRILTGETAALLERAVPAPLVSAKVSCQRDDVLVDSPGPALVVLRELWHPGWSVLDATNGRKLNPIPVSQVHQGVLIPAGKRLLQWRFRPPGLTASVVSSLLAFMAMGALLWRVRAADGGKR